MKKILFLDDEQRVLQSLRRILLSYNHAWEMVFVDRSSSALQQLQEGGFDAMVADIKMPGMSGCEILAWVAKNYPGIVRIMLTGYAGSELAIRAINEAAVYQFFTKPCNDADLAIAIRKALEHKDLQEEHNRLVDGNRLQSQRLERFHQELEILARLVVHDLKKPMAAIAQTCRTLAEKHQDVFDPKTTSLVCEAMDAVGEAERLVQSLVEDPRVNSLPKAPRGDARAPVNAST